MRWISKPQKRILLAGFGLIAVGIVCLYLSDQVVQGWWLGTLQAFGVGFIIGGVVDVLAIMSLNSSITDEQTRREHDERLAEKKRQYNLEARRFLDDLNSGDPVNPHNTKHIAQMARYLLELSDGQMDSDVRAGLQDLVNRRPG